MKFVVIKTRDTFLNPFTHDRETMTLVKTYEKTQVGRFKFYNWHYYDKDKKGHLNQWFTKPFYNQESDYKVYRQKFNLMTPSELRKLISYYGFSLRELAAVLGMSYATLSNIKQGKYIQSVEQNNLLRNLINPNLFYALIQDNLPHIKEVHPKLNYEHFKKRINKVQKMCRPEIFKFIKASDILIKK